MKKTRFSVSNMVFVVVIVLFIIPQTRQPLQVFLHKGLALISPSEISVDKQEVLSSYKDWNLMDSNGNRFDFQEAEGRVVFINFWATWCPPCIAEMPSIDNLYKDYNDRVVFLLVSNEELKTITDFQREKGYSFKFHQQLTQAPKALQTSSIPKTYIIDKKGHIVMDKTGAANWDSDSVRQVLDALLKAE